jgi:hypothetical protein
MRAVRFLLCEGASLIYMQRDAPCRPVCMLVSVALACRILTITVEYYVP